MLQNSRGELSACGRFRALVPNKSLLSMMMHHIEFDRQASNTKNCEHKKTDLDKIEMAIAKAGHDTPHHKASKNVYDELPGCCQYDRSDKKMEGSHEGHQH